MLRLKKQPVENPMGQSGMVEMGQKILARGFQITGAILGRETETLLAIGRAVEIDELIHSEQRQARSVVLTTHDLDEARAADHVILMNRRVVASGPPETVLTPENLGEAYGLGALHPTTGHLPDEPSNPY